MLGRRAIFRRGRIGRTLKYKNHTKWLIMKMRNICRSINQGIDGQCSFGEKGDKIKAKLSSGEK